MFAFFALTASVFVMPHEERSFVSWMRASNVLYTGDEYQLRLGIYLANARRVQEHNAAKKGFSVSLNYLACLTPAEYKAMLGVRRNAEVKALNEIIPNAADVDWRTKGVVNAIKDQGQCGSCWAFSAIQAAESAWAISKGKLLSFSEQDIVDCDQTSYGCDGGLMTNAYDWVIGHQGGKFELESDYPYTAVQGTCKWASSKGVGGISSYTNVKEGSDTDLMDKCKTMGPVAVAIDASHWSFQMYTSGIYDEPACSSSQLDHGVGCVGYGTDSGKDYYIVRNSWATSWGEQGYMRMLRKNNRCGIASMACVPVV